ncbi:hypothetical protein KVT40_006234 [Elsinoe batatas]|uniref:Mitochondrial inner membrane protease subunit n=1 Tax=Elsinoe batatas TaxID=2601811 RepID=A0A8K0L083_9PEZI|nr:hypothetical protein KVT40_006234 [Elsinoe batatas]
MPFSRLTTHLPRLRPYARLLTLPLWSAAIASFLNDHFAEVLSVSGRSMAPTLSPLYHETGRKDYLLLRKHNVTTDLKRGDVVAFWAPHKREFLVVKRVVGLEGDLVWLDRRRFARGPETRTGDGEVEELEHEGMMRLGVQWGDDPLDLHMGLGTKKGTVRVPPGHVWVEGDNWRESGDSNFYGPISRGLITGKAICVLWPWERCGERPWEWPMKDGPGTRVEVAGWGEMNKGGYLQE